MLPHVCAHAWAGVKNAPRAPWLLKAEAEGAEGSLATHRLSSSVPFHVLGWAELKSTLLVPQILLSIFLWGCLQVLAQPASARRESSASADARTCWICFGTDEDVELDWVSPCRCSGSTKWVHQRCLQRWINEPQSGNRDNYRVRPLPMLACVVVTCVGSSVSFIIR